jgi:hypothetical protein
MRLSKVRFVQRVRLFQVATAVERKREGAGRGDRVVLVAGTR